MEENVSCYICPDCGSTNIEPLNPDNPIELICMDCGGHLNDPYV